MDSWQVKKHMKNKLAALPKRSRGRAARMSASTVVAAHEHTMDVMLTQISFGIFNAIRAHFGKEFDTNPPGYEAIPAPFEKEFIE